MHRLDSREIVPAAEMGEEQPTHSLCAELPAGSDSIRNV